ncbi:MAG: hypothetical protein JKX72_05530, partial [Robiginitomaculum sp.]|nr:hypothetical protein [Robiginitomaculum sp.]
TVLIILATGIVFGFDTWTMFFTQTQPLMREIMDAPFMQPYQINAATIFVSMRSFGMGLEQSYFIQGLFAVACIVYGMWIWRKGSNMDHRIRVAISCVLVLLSTPYGYTYDLIPLSVAIGIFYALLPRLKLPLLFALIWLSPAFNHTIVLKSAINHVAFITLALLGLMIWSLKKSDTILAD